MRPIGWLLLILCLPGCAKHENQPESDAQVGTAESVQEITSDGLALLPQVVERRFDSTIRDIVEREDPIVDGWGSEVFAASALEQLNRLGEVLAGEPDVEPGEICAPGFTAPSLRPADLKSVSINGSITVLRPTAAPSPGPALPQALFPEQPGARCKFKIFSAGQKLGEIVTHCYFQLAHFDGAKRTQLNSTLECLWTPTEPPMLKSISVTDHEEIRATSGFADCTAAAIAATNLLDSQFIYGRDYWQGNLEGALGIEERGNGIAIGDANGDGLDDLYLCQPTALPNRLLLRQADGSLKDVSAENGVDWLDNTRSALFIDLDNDGDQDLVIGHTSALLLNENDGTGRFTLRGQLPSISLLFSINAVDFDKDGDLDLFACGYSGVEQISPQDVFASPMPYHDANNGAPNFLMRNDGDWAFSDVTKDVGLDANNLRFSLASAWEDYDGDGDLDLYVANDFGRNNLYRNDNGKFVDVADAAGVEDIGPGMSAAWGDANNDGRPDLYVSNMFSSAGSRITGQKAFKPNASESELAGFKRHARGNSLFQNSGDGTFTDQAVESGTVMGRWAWGSLFADFNNDGWQDLYVTNGFVTADAQDDL
ncbi:MAG: VCBS repeat-containing protein [Verrucomicrobia bacterium]|nr:VCBS repeat-containing protein [Verrucomicrobiota bacterium]